MHWAAVGALLLGLAVILGAFGAHALRGRLDANAMSVYERAVFYHFVHALGLLFASILPRLEWLTPSAAGWVCGLLAAGIVIFSGSLYALAISGVRGFGAITPAGGLCFIAAWLLLAALLIRAASLRS
ncbi:MAG TPA: DUF423 domain-containing protein [Bryobacteraceae bacterium]|jgi:uncharacterized membrane protein YgdD (TMEM256/DUF423 family)|nr:DUF423 domain-containing protein [Bryobacteraceae bacterium]